MGNLIVNMKVGSVSALCGIMLIIFGSITLTRSGCEFLLVQICVLLQLINRILASRFLDIFHLDFI